MGTFLRTASIGIIATAIMDVWGVSRTAFGFPRADYRMIGRWFAHMPRGRFLHESIKAAPRLPGEHLIGWCAHYGIGISFAVLLVWVGGAAWLARPTLGLPLLIGLATAVAPLFVMQPAMGAGIAGARTPDPTATRVQSVLTHLIYGAGLYVAGRIVQRILPI